MTTQIDLCNAALLRAGTRSTITSLDDGSAEATACGAFWQMCLDTLFSAYQWRFCRVTATGTGAASTDPQWGYEFQRPSDCVTVHRVLPGTAPRHPPMDREAQHALFRTGLPFGEGVGTAGTNTAGPVIRTNHASVQVQYVSNAQPIDNWRQQFREAFTWALAAEIAIAVTGSGEIAAQMRSMAQQALQQAMQADQVLEQQNADYVPDWIRVRGMPALRDEWRPIRSVTETFPGGFIVGDSAAASPTPAYLMPADTLNGVQNAGLAARDIANRDSVYIPASTPDSRIGILAIGDSPIGWRRPYHRDIKLAQPGGAGIEE
ncbi:hypothetical protein [Gluconacetobacter entanii]|uniref:Uncharacterized protein n=1 Tax=Gluconacetobacter entanii TaxID=108528 RepID=A0A318PT74_9PROT|nr:hypothetical protein [Gluconacetobacter entanii]MCE2578061.1 hypothetical protein [Komagataeibacter sp. FNDCR1]PYD61985.1 hypothetical protein CFR72_13540 [Gluconacetobacter entanii]